MGKSLRNADVEVELKKLKNGKEVGCRRDDKEWGELVIEWVWKLCNMFLKSCSVR